VSCRASGTHRTSIATILHIIIIIVIIVVVVLAKGRRGKRRRHGTGQRGWDRNGHSVASHDAAAVSPIMLRASYRGNHGRGSRQLQW
jgi:hypothetical protein